MSKPKQLELGFTFVSFKDIRGEPLFIKPEDIVRIQAHIPKGTYLITLKGNKQSVVVKATAREIQNTLAKASYTFIK